MLFNDVIMTSLVHNYVDHGPISIPTRFQTNTPNNKVATVERGGGGSPTKMAPKIAWPGLALKIAWPGLSKNWITFSSGFSSANLTIKEIYK